MISNNKFKDINFIYYNIQSAICPQKNCIIFDNKKLLIYNKQQWS